MCIQYTQPRRNFQISLWHILHENYYCYLLRERESSSYESFQNIILNNIKDNCQNFTTSGFSNFPRFIIHEDIV